MLRRFPAIENKAYENCTSWNKIEARSEEEAAGIAGEILRRFSQNDSPKGVMHVICYPTEFHPGNCNGGQIEIDENYLAVFKSLYLDKFILFIDESLDSLLENVREKNVGSEPSSTTMNFYSPVGAVQSGSNNNALITQNIGLNVSEILEQLTFLREQFQCLPSDEREEAIEIIDAFAIEVESEKPSKGKIKAFLTATRDFAVKTGTELAASTLAKLLETQLGIKS